MLYGCVDQGLGFGCCVLVVELYWVVFCGQIFIDVEKCFDVLVFDQWQIVEVMDVGVGWVEFVGWNVDYFFVLFVVVYYFQVVDWVELYDYFWM